MAHTTTRFRAGRHRTGIALAAAAVVAGAIVVSGVAASAPTAVRLPSGCVLRPGGRCAGARLSGRDLSARGLSRIDLAGAALVGANLSRANLDGANLGRANLSRARLTVAHLVHANLSHANLAHAALADANLSGANVTGANLAWANLAGAAASGVRGVPRALPSGYELRGGNIVVRPPASAAVRHVVWIVMENQSLAGILGNPQAPYANALAQGYGLATDYFAVAHPSLPNYIALTSGGTQGIVDDNNPSSHRLAVASIFGQLGGNWRSLNESMPSNCDQANSGLYAVRHNPAVYYTSVSAACAIQDMPLAPQPDISAALTVVTPNLCDDAHSCAVSVGDTWLRGFVPRLLANPLYAAGSTAIFVVWDESASATSNRVPLIAISPWTRRITTAGAFTHYSLLRTTEDLLGLPALGAASSARSMAVTFNLP